MPLGTRHNPGHCLLLENSETAEGEARQAGKEAFESGWPYEILGFRKTGEKVVKGRTLVGFIEVEK